jgi:hypothetical protein
MSKENEIGTAGSTKTEKEKYLLNYEGVMISPYPDKEGNKPQQRNSGFIQHTPNEAQYTS